MTKKNPQKSLRLPRKKSVFFKKAMGDVTLTAEYTPWYLSPRKCMGDVTLTAEYTPWYLTPRKCLGDVMPTAERTPWYLTPRKCVALFLSLCQILTSSPAYPAEIPKTVQRSPSNIQVEFSIPEKLGTLEEFHTAPSSKTVIYIQDAHDSLEAQENIAKLIHTFVDKYGVKTVLEEGYEGPVPTDKYFGKIKDPQVRRRTAYFLMDKLRLGGAEYAHITRFDQAMNSGSWIVNRDISKSIVDREKRGNDFSHTLHESRSTIHASHDFQLIGADSLRLHQENIQRYQESASHQKETAEDLRVMDAELRKMTQRYFTRELKEWMVLKEKLDRKEIDLLDYLKRTQILFLKGIGFEEFRTAYPSISLLLSAAETKDKKILSKLRTSVNYKTLFQEINRLEDAYVANHLAVRAADAGGIAQHSNSPVVGAYGHTPVQDKAVIKAASVTDLGVGVIPRVLPPEQIGGSVGLLGGNDLRMEKVFHYYKLIQLLKRLNNIEVTEEEYEAVKENLREMNTTKIADFIVAQTHQSIVLSKLWEKNIQSAVRFYEIAHERDGSIQNRLEDYRNGASTAPVVLVYGGFHKGSIIELLQQSGFSYAVVTPRITSISLKHQNYYRQLMLMGYDNMALPKLVSTATTPPRFLNFAAVSAKSEVRMQNELNAIVQVVSRQKTDTVEEMDLAFTRSEVRLSQNTKGQVLKPTDAVSAPLARSEVRSTRRQFLANVSAMAGMMGLPLWILDLAAQEKAVRGDAAVPVLKNAFAGLSRYLTDGYGVHEPTGAPRDHLIFDPQTYQPFGGPKNYGAPSKDAVYLPALMHIVLGNPLFSKSGISRQRALELMLKDLTALRAFQENYGETRDVKDREIYGGFYPWNNKLDDGTIRAMKFNARVIVPSLDNGQLSMALAAVAGSFWDAQPGTLEGQVSDRAREILDHQDYRKFMDADGKIFQLWDLDQNKGTPGSDKDTLWTEWGIAYLWAHWIGALDEKALLKFNHDTFIHESPMGKLDMPQGFIFSFHELWGLQYFHKLIMKSELAPLMRNFLYLHAQHAREKGMRGFSAPEYAPNGQYIGSGINLTGHTREAVQKEDLAAPYGTALGALINPASIEWLAYLFEQPGVVNPNGFVTSFTQDEGASFYHSADNTFSTMNTAAEWYNANHGIRGGTNDGLARYLRERYGVKEEKIIASFNLIARDILRKLGRDRFYAVTPEQIPGVPAQKDFSIRGKPAKTPDIVKFSERLIFGDWHSVNTKTPPEFDTPQWKVPADKDRTLPWIMMNGEMIADYELAPGSSFAFIGTTFKPVAIHGARFISYWIPANSKNEVWEVELKNGGEITKRVRIDTSLKPDEISADGKWKRYIQPFEPLGIAERLPLTYVAISTTRPKGRIHIKDIELSVKNPSRSEVRTAAEIQLWKGPGAPAFEESIYKLWNFLAANDDKSNDDITRILVDDWTVNGNLVARRFLNEVTWHRLEARNARFGIQGANRFAASKPSFINPITNLLEGLSYPGLSASESSALGDAIQNILQHVLSPGQGRGIILVLDPNPAAAPADKELYIYVLDSGPGMPLRDVFENNFRAGTTGFGSDLKTLRTAPLDLIYESWGQRYQAGVGMVNSGLTQSQRGTLFAMRIRPKVSGPAEKALTETPLRSEVRATPEDLVSLMPQIERVSLQPQDKEGREATLYLSKGDFAQHFARGSRNLEALREAVTRNYKQRPNQRSFYIDLPDEPFVDQHGRRWVRLQLKGIVFDARQPISAHSEAAYRAAGAGEHAKGFVDDRYEAFPDGIIRNVGAQPSPDGAMALDKAIREFALASSINQNQKLASENYFAPGAIAYGEFPGVFFEGQPLGFVVLGIDDEMAGAVSRMDENSPYVTGAVTRALSKLHQAGYTHPFLHGGNLSTNVSRTKWYVHDLDAARFFTAERDSLAHAAAAQARDFFYLLKKYTVDRYPVEGAEVNVKFGFASLQQMLQAYLPEDWYDGQHGALLDSWTGDLIHADGDELRISGGILETLMDDYLKPLEKPRSQVTLAALAHSYQTGQFRPVARSLEMLLVNRLTSLGFPRPLRSETRRAEGTEGARHPTGERAETESAEDPTGRRTEPDAQRSEVRSADSGEITLASGRKIPASLSDNFERVFISARDLLEQDYFAVRVNRRDVRMMTDAQFAEMDVDDITEGNESAQFHDYQIRVDELGNIFVEYEPWDENMGPAFRWPLPAEDEESFNLLVFDAAKARKNWRRIHEILQELPEGDDQAQTSLANEEGQAIVILKDELIDLRGDILTIYPETMDGEHGFVIRRLDSDPITSFELFYNPKSRSEVRGSIADSIAAMPYHPKWLTEAIQRQLENELPPLIGEIKPLFQNSRRQSRTLFHGVISMKRPDDDRERAAQNIIEHGFDWNRFALWQSLPGRGVHTTTEGNDLWQPLGVPTLKLKFKGKVLNLKSKNQQDKIVSTIEKLVESRLLSQGPLLDQFAGSREEAKLEATWYIFDLLFEVFKIDGIGMGNSAWFTIKRPSAIQSIQRTAEPEYPRSEVRTNKIDELLNEMGQTRATIPENALKLLKSVAASPGFEFYNLTGPVLGLINDRDKKIKYLTLLSDIAALISKDAATPAVSEIIRAQFTDQVPVHIDFTRPLPLKKGDVWIEDEDLDGFLLRLEKFHSYLTQPEYRESFIRLYQKKWLAALEEALPAVRLETDEIPETTFYPAAGTDFDHTGYSDREKTIIMVDIRTDDGEILTSLLAQIRSRKDFQITEVRVPQALEPYLQVFESESKPKIEIIPQEDARFFEIIFQTPNGEKRLKYYYGMNVYDWKFDQKPVFINYRRFWPLREGEPNKTAKLLSTLALGSIWSGYQSEDMPEGMEVLGFRKTNLKEPLFKERYFAEQPLYRLDQKYSEAELTERVSAVLHAENIFGAVIGNPDLALSQLEQILLSPTTMRSEVRNKARTEFFISLTLQNGVVERPGKYEADENFWKVVEAANPGIFEKVKKLIATYPDSATQPHVKGRDFTFQSGRTYIVRLENPVPYPGKNGELITFYDLILKGAPFKKGEAGQTFDMATLYPPTASGAITKKHLEFDRDGTGFEEQDFNERKDALNFRDAEREYDIGRDAFLNPDAPVIALPAMLFEYQDEMSADGENPLAVEVIASPRKTLEKNAEQLARQGWQDPDHVHWEWRSSGDNVVLSLLARLNNADRGPMDAQTYATGVMTYMQRYGQSLRRFHKAGYTHGNFHTGNSAAELEFVKDAVGRIVEIRQGESTARDLTDARLKSEMTKEQMFGYVVRDINYAVTGISIANLPLRTKRILLREFFEGYFGPQKAGEIFGAVSPLLRELFGYFLRRELMGALNPNPLQINADLDFRYAGRSWHFDWDGFASGFPLLVAIFNQQVSQAGTERRKLVFNDPADPLTKAIREIFEEFYARSEVRRDVRTTARTPGTRRPARAEVRKIDLAEKESGWLRDDLNIPAGQILTWLEGKEIQWSMKKLNHKLRGEYPGRVPYINEMGGSAGMAHALGVERLYRQKIEAVVDESFGMTSYAAKAFDLFYQNLEVVYSRLVRQQDGKEATLDDIPLTPGGLLSLIPERIKRFSFAVEHAQKPGGRPHLLYALNQALKKDAAGRPQELATPERIQTHILDWLRTPDSEKNTWPLLSLRAQLLELFPELSSTAFDYALLLWELNLQENFRLEYEKRIDFFGRVPTYIGQSFGFERTRSSRKMRLILNGLDGLARRGKSPADFEQDEIGAAKKKARRVGQVEDVSQLRVLEALSSEKEGRSVKTADILAELDAPDLDWNLPEFFRRHPKIAWLKNRGYHVFFIAVGLESVVRTKLRERYEYYNGMNTVIAESFGLDLKAAKHFYKDMGLPLNLMSVRSGSLLKTFGVTKNEILERLVQSKWEDLPKLRQDLLSKFNAAQRENQKPVFSENKSFFGVEDILWGLDLVNDFLAEVQRRQQPGTTKFEVAQSFGFKGKKNVVRELFYEMIARLRARQQAAQKPPALLFDGSDLEVFLGQFASEQPYGTVMILLDDGKKGTWRTVPGPYAYHERGGASRFVSEMKGLVKEHMTAPYAWARRGEHLKIEPASRSEVRRDVRPMARIPDTRRPARAEVRSSHEKRKQKKQAERKKQKAKKAASEKTRLTQEDRPKRPMDKKPKASRNSSQVKLEMLKTLAIQGQVSSRDWIRYLQAQAQGIIDMKSAAEPVRGQEIDMRLGGLDDVLAILFAYEPAEKVIPILQEVNAFWDEKDPGHRSGNFMQHVVMSHKKFLMPEEYELMQYQIFDAVSKINPLEDRLWAWWLYLIASTYHLRHFGLHTENGLTPGRAIDPEVIIKLLKEYFLPDYLKWRKEHKTQIEQGKQGIAEFKEFADADRSLLWAFGTALDYRLYDADSHNHDSIKVNEARQTKGELPIYAREREVYPRGAADSIPALYGQLLKDFPAGTADSLNADVMRNLMREAAALWEEDHSKAQPEFKWDEAFNRLKEALPGILAHGRGFKEIPQMTGDELELEAVSVFHVRTRLLHATYLYRIDPYIALRNALEKWEEPNHPEDFLAYLVEQTGMENIKTWSFLEPLIAAAAQRVRENVIPENMISEKAGVPWKSEKGPEAVEELSFYLRALTSEFNRNPFQVRTRPLSSVEDLQPGVFFKNDNREANPQMRGWDTEMVISRFGKSGEFIFTVDDSYQPTVWHANEPEIQTFLIAEPGQGKFFEPQTPPFGPMADIPIERRVIKAHRSEVRTNAEALAIDEKFLKGQLIAWGATSAYSAADWKSLDQTLKEWRPLSLSETDLYRPWTTVNPEFPAVDFLPHETIRQSFSRNLYYQSLSPAAQAHWEERLFEVTDALQRGISFWAESLPGQARTVWDNVRSIYLWHGQAMDPLLNLTPDTLKRDIDVVFLTGGAEAYLGADGIFHFEQVPRPVHLFMMGEDLLAAGSDLQSLYTKMALWQGVPIYGGDHFGDQQPSDWNLLADLQYEFTVALHKIYPKLQSGQDEGYSGLQHRLRRVSLLWDQLKLENSWSLRLALFALETVLGADFSPLSQEFNDVFIQPAWKQVSQRHRLEIIEAFLDRQNTVSGPAAVINRSEMRETLERNSEGSGPIAKLDIDPDVWLQMIAFEAQASVYKTGSPFSDKMKVPSRGLPKIENVDPDELPNPAGPVVALFSYAFSGAPLAAFFSNQSDLENVNFILIPPFGSLWRGSRPEDGAYITEGLFYDPKRGLVLARFKRPVRIHALAPAGLESSKLVTELEELGLPLLNVNAGIELTHDKSAFGNLLKQHGLSTPEFTLLKAGSGENDVQRAIEAVQASEIAMKPVRGSSSTGAKLFSLPQSHGEAVRHGIQITAHGEEAMVQKRISSRRWKRLRTGPWYDMNLRVITTWNGDHFFMDEKNIVVRYQPDYGRSVSGPVSVDKGAKANTLQGFLRDLGFTPEEAKHEGQQIMDEIQPVLSTAAAALEEEVRRLKGSHPGGQPLTGLVGWDLIYSDEGKWYVLEANIGPVGGIEDLESFNPQAEKGNSLRPVLRYLAQSAKSYQAVQGISADSPELRPAAEVLDPVALYNIARSLYLTSRVGLAESIVRVGLTLDEKHEGLWKILGDILFKQGRRAEAVQAYIRALELDPDLRPAAMGLQAVASVHFARYMLWGFTVFLISGGFGGSSLAGLVISLLTSTYHLWNVFSEENFLNVFARERTDLRISQKGMYVLGGLLGAPLGVWLGTPASWPGFGLALLIHLTAAVSWKVISKKWQKKRTEPKAARSEVRTGTDESDEPESDIRTRLKNSFGHKEGLPDSQRVPIENILDTAFGFKTPEARKNRELRILDIGTQAGHFMVNIKKQLEALGYRVAVKGLEPLKNKAIDVGLTAHKGILGPENFILGQVTEDGEIKTFNAEDWPVQQVNETFDLIFANAPDFTRNRAIYDWILKAYQRYRAPQGLGFIRLYEGSQFDEQLKMQDGSILAGSLATHPDIPSLEFDGQTTPELVRGTHLVGPLILLSPSPLTVDALRSEVRVIPEAILTTKNEAIKEYQRLLAEQDKTADPVRLETARQQALRMLGGVGKEGEALDFWQQSEWQPWSASPEQLKIFQGWLPKQIKLLYEQIVKPQGVQQEQFVQTLLESIRQIQWQTIQYLVQEQHRAYRGLPLTIISERSFHRASLQVLQAAFSKAPDIRGLYSEDQAERFLLRGERDGIDEVAQLDAVHSRVTHIPEGGARLENLNAIAVGVVSRVFLNAPGAWENFLKSVIEETLHFMETPEERDQFKQFAGDHNQNTRLEAEMGIPEMVEKIAAAIGPEVEGIHQQWPRIRRSEVRTGEESVQEWRRTFKEKISSPRGLAAGFEYGKTFFEALKVVLRRDFGQDFLNKRFKLQEILAQVQKIMAQSHDQRLQPFHFLLYGDQSLAENPELASQVFQDYREFAVAGEVGMGTVIFNHGHTLAGVMNAVNLFFNNILFIIKQKLRDPSHSRYQLRTTPDEPGPSRTDTGDVNKSEGLASRSEVRLGSDELKRVLDSMPDRYQTPTGYKLQLPLNWRQKILTHTELIGFMESLELAIKANLQHWDSVPVYHYVGYYISRSEAGSYSAAQDIIDKGLFDFSKSQLYRYSGRALWGNVGQWTREKNSSRAVLGMRFSGSVLIGENDLIWQIIPFLNRSGLPQELNIDQTWLSTILYDVLMQTYSVDAVYSSKTNTLQIKNANGTVSQITLETQPPSQRSEVRKQIAQSISLREMIEKAGPTKIFVDAAATVEFPDQTAGELARLAKAGAEVVFYNLGIARSENRLVKILETFPKTAFHFVTGSWNDALAGSEYVPDAMNLIHYSEGETGAKGLAPDWAQKRVIYLAGKPGAATYGLSQAGVLRKAVEADEIKESLLAQLEISEKNGFYFVSAAKSAWMRLQLAAESIVAFAASA